jgi:uncharacterized membrane protein
MLSKPKKTHFQSHFTLPAFYFYFIYLFIYNFFVVWNFAKMWKLKQNILSQFLKPIFFGNKLLHLEFDFGFVGFIKIIFFLTYFDKF